LWPVAAAWLALSGHGVAAAPAASAADPATPATAIGAIKIPASRGALAVLLTELVPEQKIERSDWSTPRYHPEFQKIVAAAIALQALPHPEAEALLRRWTKSLPLGSDPRPIILLGHLLFDPASPDEKFTWPMTGPAGSMLAGHIAFMGGTAPADWADRPITYVAGVPFAIWDQWYGPEQPFESQDLSLIVDDFVAKGHWTKRVYPAITAEKFLAALRQLEASPVFHRPLDDAEREALRNQFDLPPVPRALPELPDSPPIPSSVFARCAFVGYAEGLLEAASALQALPPDLALAQLRAWAEADDRGDPFSYQSFGSRLLCLMLFDPRPGGALVDTPFTFSILWSRIDRAGNLAPAASDGLPPVPGVVPRGLLVLVDGIPFLAADRAPIVDFSGPLPRNLAVSFFDYCRRNGHWTSRPYRPATAAELNAALKKVLAWYMGVQATMPKSAYTFTPFPSEFFAKQTVGTILP
jgi:hypothetical protein